MKDSRKVLLYLAVISLMTDIVEGVESVDMDQLVDCLAILKFDHFELLTLSPAEAIHKVCTEFVKIEITDQVLLELKNGDEIE